MPNVFLEGLQRPAILQNNSGLPDYSEANDGDVLQIASGEPAWGAVDALPEIEETDEGKVLAVDQGEAVWADAPSGLPEITAQDEGKVLTVVDNSGTLEAEWAEPSGGGGEPTPDLSITFTTDVDWENITAASVPFATAYSTLNAIFEAGEMPHVEITWGDGSGYDETFLASVVFGMDMSGNGILSFRQYYDLRLTSDYAVYDGSHYKWTANSVTFNNWTASNLPTIGNDTITVSAI